jgi:hypothetical protein
MLPIPEAGGRYGPGNGGRCKTVTARPDLEEEVGTPGMSVTPVEEAGSPPALPSGSLSWAALLKRVFAIDILICPAAEADGASSALQWPETA